MLSSCLLCGQRSEPTAVMQDHCSGHSCPPQQVLWRAGSLQACYQGDVPAVKPCATTVPRTLQMALGNQFWREGICFQGDSPVPQAYQFTAVPPPQVSVYVSELCQHSVTGSVSDWILVRRTPLDCRHLGHSVNSSYVSEHAVLTCQIPASVRQVPLPTVRHVAVAICILNAPPSMACVVKAWFLARLPLGQGGRTFRRWSLLEGR